jgi:hypothetical protein
MVNPLEEFYRDEGDKGDEKKEQRIFAGMNR